MANAKARLAEAYTCFSPCSSKITDLGLSYTVRGETSDVYESTPNSGGYYHSSTSFWANGVPETVTGPAGYWMTYNPDGEGRVNSTNGGGNYLTGTNYNPAGQIIQMNFSSGDSDAYSYDSNTGRMTQYQFNVGTLHQALTGALTWNSNGSLQNLSTQDLFNISGTQNCSYHHDDMTRIGSVNCSGSQLQNPGFEQGLASWTPSDSGVTVVTDSTKAHSGNDYVQISIPATRQSSVVINSNPLPVSPGDQVAFGGFAYLESGSATHVGWVLVGLNSSLTQVVWAVGSPYNISSGSWTYQASTYTVPSGIAYVQVYCEVYGPTTATVARCDDGFIEDAPVWSQTFAYDAFGNINKTGNSSFNPSYSSATNRMTQIGSSTPTYDANGNVTNDFLHTYAWDANGRPVTIDGVGVTYDALGTMVEQNRSGAYSQFAYSTTGVKLGILGGQSWQKIYVPLVGGSTEVIPSVGSAYYTHFDWLGNARLMTTPSQTVVGDVTYAPFGETYASSGNPWISFTGMDSDTSSNLYDFPAREYGIQGRWPSPDPAGLLAVDPSNPQTWNRYAYVLNNPLSLVDPTGLSCTTFEGITICTPDLTTSPVSLCPPGGTATGACSGYPFCPLSGCKSDAQQCVANALKNGGNAAACAGGHLQPPQVPSKPEVNNCLNQFQNSFFGKKNNFFSAINLVTNFKNAWPDWTIFPAAKIGAVAAGRQMIGTIGNTEFLSVTGGTSTVVSAPTVAGIDAVESASGVGLLAIPFATAIDAGVRNFCSSFPNATLSFSLTTVP